MSTKLGSMPVSASRIPLSVRSTKKLAFLPFPKVCKSCVTGFPNTTLFRQSPIRIERIILRIHSDIECRVLKCRINPIARCVFFKGVSFRAINWNVSNIVPFIPCSYLPAFRCSLRKQIIPGVSVVFFPRLAFCFCSINLDIFIFCQPEGGLSVVGADVLHEKTYKFFAYLLNCLIFCVLF